MGLGSPWLMKYALPAAGEPGPKASHARTWASAAVVDVKAVHELVPYHRFAEGIEPAR